MSQHDAREQSSAIKWLPGPIQRRRGEVIVQIAGSQLEKATGTFIDAMNDLQSQGLTIDQVIATMLYMAGAAIKQRRAVLNVDAPLSVALPPIVAGYNASEHASEWQI